MLPTTFTLIDIDLRWNWVSNRIHSCHKILHLFFFNFTVLGDVLLSNDRLIDLQTMGMCIVLQIVIIVNIKVYFMQNLYSKLSVCCIMFSIGMYFISILLEKFFLPFGNMADISFMGTFTFWIVTAIGCTSVLLI